jgi:hypothetical protein
MAKFGKPKSLIVVSFFGRVWPMLECGCRWDGIDDYLLLDGPGEEAGGDAPPAAEGLGEAHFGVGGGGDEHEHEQAGVGEGDEHDAEEFAIAGEVALFGAEGEDGVGDVEGPGEAEADVEESGDFEGEGVAEEGEKRSWVRRFGCRGVFFSVLVGR